MAKPKITLFLDVVSPFAYMGFYALHNFPIFKTCEITYVPIFLGALLRQCGNITPLNIKNKDKWINTNRIRLARLLHIPISPAPPPGFPINILPIQRTLVSLSQSHPSVLPAAIAAFFDNIWLSYTPDVEKDENKIVKVLTEVLGSEKTAREVVQRRDTGAVKEALKRNTDEAFEQGAFGVPWFVATNVKGEKEVFWGVDNIGQMVDHLVLERPDGKAWKALL